LRGVGRGSAPAPPVGALPPTPPQGPNKTTCIRRFPKGDRKALWSPVRAKPHLAQKPCLYGKVVNRHEEKPPPGGDSAVRRWGSLRCSGHEFLQGVALVGRSFSGLRKNQREPEGVSQFIPPGDTPSGLPPFPRSCEGY